MAAMQAKEFYVTWDGDPATWANYTRKVRLQWEKTFSWKRRHLGPELASRLTGRAWAVTYELSHEKLSKKNGTKYLLRYLQDRLCRTPVPDAGARLEDLLIRLRRPLGMTMSQWSNEVQEAYRKVQRALVRARKMEPKKDLTKAILDKTTSSKSEPHGEPQGGAGSQGVRTPSVISASGTAARTRTPVQEGEAVVEEEVGRDLHEAEHGEDWKEEEWEDWRKFKKWKQTGRAKSHQEDSGEDLSSGEDLPWDELEVEDVQVLPDEVLGWLLLRRANLSSSSRLSVQASVQNSLSFRAIERALRDQEEELLHVDAHRPPQQQRRRTYWVEEEGAWGLLMTPDDAMEELSGEVHWVGDRLPAEVYPQAAEEHLNDEVYWSWDDSGWRGYLQDDYGYWVETDGYGTFWASEGDLFGP